MFKYASVLGLAREQGRQMFIESGTDLEQTFRLRYVGTHLDTSQWLVITEANPVAFDEKLMHLPKQHLKIAGFLQSFVYFAHVVNEVKQEFTFHDSVANDAAKILQTVYAQHNSTLLVGVHVRRGDFLTDYGQYWGYGVPNTTYFKQAFQMIRSKFPYRRITFLVASDDLPWCRDNLTQKDVFVMPPASAAVHLAVLTSCDHVIISGGTFSWWSGWLANGIVIYYTGYMGKDTPLGQSLNIRTYYPRQWIGLDN